MVMGLRWALMCDISTTVCGLVLRGGFEGKGIHGNETLST